jgi:hypothetical protein
MPNGLGYPKWAAALVGEPESGLPSSVQLSLLAENAALVPSLELVPPVTSLPIELLHSGLIQSVLVPLVNQFGLMQQQMFDQFQQAMTMMVQMFGTMHRNQMEAIRAELEQLRELTQEFHALKTELANLTREQTKQTSGERPNVLAGLDAGMGVSASARAAEAAVPRSPAAASEPLQGRETFRADSVLPVSSPVSKERQPIAESLCSHPREPTPSGSFVAPTASQEFQASVPSSARSSAGLSAEADSDGNTLMWLHHRIMTIQSERTSRWQKILKLWNSANSVETS